jgi:ATP-dependent RNA helicase SUPV3L1/SUV3
MAATPFQTCERMTAPGPRLTAILGPTNTGKTFLAMERMLGHSSGIIGFPLRLLARENYERAVREKGREAVALVTGEEKIVPKHARYFVCTVESMPLDRPVGLIAVDEAQLAADPERGHVFTDRLLNARGLSETMFMGSESIANWLRVLLPDVQFVRRPRLSTLTHVGYRKLTRLPPRSAVVAFSLGELYRIADLLRRQRGGAAIVMGALSPATRNAQVEIYQSGEVDYLVATDAIGMGLNLDVHHVWFASLRKFDGRTARALNGAEISQIAGRAGRYMSDGTFGVTAEAEPMPEELIETVEQHRVRPLPHLLWRNSALDFRSLGHLRASLERRPKVEGLIRKGDAEDHAALLHLAEDSEIQTLTANSDRVRLLWDVCQIPDFRKLMTDAHPRLLGQIFKLLIEGPIGDDWMAGQFERLDRADGDIDQLTQRIAHIRTWAYVANHAQWVRNPLHWKERAQALEDRLSEALHQALTERFVDRRRAAFNRGLKSGSEMQALVAASNEVLVEGHVVGVLLGLRFIPSAGSSGAEMRPLLAAARRALLPVLATRLLDLESEDDRRFRISPDGEVRWRDASIARLRAGDTALNPRVELLADELLNGDQRRRVEQRVRRWLDGHLRRRLRALVELTEADLAAHARGLAYQIAERLGAIARSAVVEQLGQLSRADRAELARLGVRIGRETIWLPGLNGAGQRALLVQLYRLWQGGPGNDMPEAITLPQGDFARLGPDLDEGLLLAAGYRRLGAFAVGFDRLERIANRLHKLARQKAIKWDAALAAALDVPEEGVKGLLNALGFVAGGRTSQPTYRRRPRRAPPASLAKPDSPFAALADWRPGQRPKK